MGAANNSVKDGDSPEEVTKAQRQDIVGAAAALAGLAGYITLLGWVVSTVRLTSAGLPSDAATSFLSSTEMLRVGARAILLTAGPMAIAFALLCCISYGLSALNWKRNGPSWEWIIFAPGVRKARTIVARTEPAPALSAHRAVAIRIVAGFNLWVPAVVAGGVVAQVVTPIAQPSVLIVTNGALSRVLPTPPGVSPLTLIVWAAVSAFVYEMLSLAGPLRGGPYQQVAIFTFMSVAALLAPAPLGLLIVDGILVCSLGRRLARYERPPTITALLRSALPWAVLTFCALPSLAWYATAPVAFRLASVLTAHGAEVGGYLGSDASGVYLVTCTAVEVTSVDERIAFTRWSDVEHLVLGGPDDQVDSGERPSLVSFIFSAVGVKSPSLTLVNLNLRPRRPTCAGAGLRLTVGYAAPALGTGVIAGPAPPDGRASDGETPIQNERTPRLVAELARRYEPTLEVSVADRFWPVSVAAVIHDVGSEGQSTCLVRAVAPNSCTPIQSLAALASPSSTTTDYLQYPAPLSNDPTDEFLAFERGQSVVVGPTREWLQDPGLLDPWKSAQIYFYFAGPLDAARWRFLQTPAGIPSGLIGLEYWFYYPYNYFPTDVDSSLITDAPIAGDMGNTDLHQGDWEHVTVLLDPVTLAPKWLYMARHSFEGEFVRWTDPHLLFDEGHPVVQASFGGHVTYGNTCGERSRAVLQNLFPGLGGVWRRSLCVSCPEHTRRRPSKDVVGVLAGPFRRRGRPTE